MPQSKALVVRGRPAARRDAPDTRKRKRRRGHSSSGKRLSNSRAAVDRRSVACDFHARPSERGRAYAASVRIETWPDILTQRSRPSNSCMAPRRIVRHRGVPSRSIGSCPNSMRPCRTQPLRTSVLRVPKALATTRTCPLRTIAAPATSCSCVISTRGSLMSPTRRLVPSCCANGRTHRQSRGRV